MRLSMQVASKAGRIWRDKTSVGRKPRRPEGSANSPGSHRAGFEPRRGRDLAADCPRIQALVSRQLSMNAGPHRTAQIRRGITVRDSGSPGRAEIFALPALDHSSPLT